MTDVVRFYNKYNNAYFGTVLGLFSYYGSDREYRANGPNGEQLLVLKQFEPKRGQIDRGFVVYSGARPLGARTMDLTKFGTKEKESNTTCGLGFSAGNRRGLDTCAFLSGIDSQLPSRPSNSDSVATWSEYQTALSVWAQKNCK